MAFGSTWLRRRPALLLLLLGGLSVLLYAGGLAARYPLAAGLQDPRSNWARIAGASYPSFAVHLALYLFLAVLYWLAVQLLYHAGQAKRRVPYGGWIIVGIWLAASVVLWAISPAGEARDIYDYSFRGHMLVEYGGSPLALVPDQFPDAPYLAFITWHDHVDTYGPLWEYASGAVALAVRGWLYLSGGWHSGLPSCPQDARSCAMLVAYLTGYRLLAMGAAGLSGWLVVSMVKRQSPGWEQTALLLWLWNPLLLISSAVGAHNDLVMLLLVLATLWLLQRRHWLAGLLVLILAAHVKATVLILAPAVGLWLVRQMGWRRALTYSLATAAIGLLLSWSLYTPLGGWETLPRMVSERSRYVANSLHHVAYRLLWERGMAASTLHDITIYWPSLFYVLFAVFTSIGLLGVRRVPAAGARHEDERLWRAVVVLNGTYLLIGSFWFQPWYCLWVLAPAVLMPQSRFTRHVLPWLALGSLWSNVVADYLPQFYPPPLNRTQRVISVVTVTWLPAVLAALIWLWPATAGKWSGKAALVRKHQHSISGVQTKVE
ncbi:MAG: DUF2029 domain-containing protein [Caldilineaceae bacterium]|nr:DUF2029 domain-containing protein [Caldilineaceae bacterium]